MPVGSAMMPAMDDMLMIEPPPASRSAGMAAFVPRNAPLALTSRTASHCSGVVDEDVEPAVAVECGLHGGVPVVGAGYVEMDIGGFAAEFGYLGFNPLAFVVEQVVEDDFRAFPGEQYRLGSSLSARAAAYEGYLAVQPSHGESP